jgi:hypothetical protein
MGQRFRIELFRKAGEPADVAEHDCHDTRLTAELESFGVGGQLVDIVRRHVMRESASDLALPRLGSQITEQRGDEVDERHHRPGKDRVDQQLRVSEEEP